MVARPHVEKPEIATEDQSYHSPRPVGGFASTHRRGDSRDWPAVLARPPGRPTGSPLRQAPSAFLKSWATGTDTTECLSEQLLPPRRRRTRPVPCQGPSNELGRDELYRMVWAEPVEKLAARYAISGGGLAKICARLDIPVPPRGYWAQLQHGYKPERLPLPPPSGGVPTTVTIHGHAVKTTAASTLPPDTLAEVEREQQPERRIRVPERIARFHPRVRATRAAMNGRTPDSTGSCDRSPRGTSPAGLLYWTFAWPGPRFPGLSASWTRC
jgi:hypothetical protein